MWGIIAEDLPETANHVDARPRLTDTTALPAPKIIYRNAETTRRISRSTWRGRTKRCGGGRWQMTPVPLMRDSAGT